MIDFVKKNLDTIRFIHIGKCGGETIKHFFTLHETKITTYHVFDHIEYDDNMKYIICIRNPILRAISAFNFRYHECNKIPRSKYYYAKENEEKILHKYENLNNLALELYNSDIKNEITHKELFTIGHIEHNISYYLRDLFKTINSDQILYIFKQENLNEDIKTFFNIKKLPTIYHHRSNKKKFLSKTAYKNLKKALQPDYECLNKLIQFNKIEKEFIKYYKE
jgi:hypothetical protein